MSISMIIAKHRLPRRALPWCALGALLGASAAASAGETGQHKDATSAKKHEQMGSAEYYDDKSKGKTNDQSNAGTNDAQNRTSNTTQTPQAGTQNQHVSQTRDAQNTQQEMSQSEQTGQKNPRFTQVDQNQDEQLVWTEIHAIYDDELAHAEWDEEAVFSTYDINNDQALNNDEYLIFVGGLTDQPVTQQTMAQNQQQGQQSDQQQARQQAASSAQQSRANGGEMAAAPADQQQQADESVQPLSIVTVTTVTGLTEEELEDREVINMRGESIGEVEDVITNAEGQVSGLVVGVGGFWDIGDKDVRVDLDELTASGDYIVWDTPLSEETLDNLPAYGDEEVSVVY